MTSVPSRFFAAVFLCCAIVVGGDLEKANRYLREALEASDNAQRITLLRQSLREQVSFTGHYQLGKALRDAGRHPEAISEFRAALELTTPDEKQARAHALFQIGNTLVVQGNGAEALRYMRLSLEIEKHPAVEQAILRLQKQLAGSIQPAATLARALTLASKDLVLEDMPDSFTQPGVPVWIHFAFRSAELNAEGMEQARQLGQAIASADLQGQTIRVVGHTDLFGEAEYNLDLSRRRAQTVASYLVARFSIPRSRVVTEGRGMQEPIVTTGSQDEQAVNRRVEIVLGAPANTR